MDGLDLDDENEGRSPSQESRERQHREVDYRDIREGTNSTSRSTREFSRKSESLGGCQIEPHTPQEEALLQELKAAKEEIKERERHIQLLEEANDRLLFRMRNLQVEIQGKDKTIHELNQEINYVKRKLDKPTEILVNEIKHKDLLIETLKRRQQQYRSDSIPIDPDGERGSFSQAGSYFASYINPLVPQNSYICSRPRVIRQNRASVQDETEIINEWNKVLQIFYEADANLIRHLRQYVILSISRLAMLEQTGYDDEEGIYRDCCYLCSEKFDCFHKACVCYFCRFMFCKRCAPRKLVLGANNKSQRVCVLCEHMYKFVNMKDSKEYS